VKRVPFAAAFALILLAGAQRAQWTATVLAHDPVPTTPTFAGEIRGVLAARCAACHAAGGSAPMPLTTVEEIRPWARGIREQVLTRRMPKWHAARGYGAFVNDATLTPYEQALIVAWLDAGLPEGTPRGSIVSGPPAAFGRGSDDTGAIRVVIPPRGDVGRTAGSADVWITGWAFAPGDPLITAAVVSVNGTPIGAWVAGDLPTRLPAGLGFRSGVRIRVDVRRRTAAAQEQPFEPRRSVLTLLTGAGLTLQRAWTEQVACGAPRSGPPAHLLAVRPLLDRAEARLSVSRPGAAAAIVGWFREFDPLYPRTYWLVRPIEMGPETRFAADGPCRVELTLAPAAIARR
jgi:hypothetical protein